MKKPAFGVSTLIVLFILLIAIFGPVLSPNDPLKSDLSFSFAPSSMQYPLGNDSLGRCLLSRILCGASMSIGIGFAVTLVSCIIGVLIGLVSGYFGGIIDEICMTNHMLAIK